MGSFRHEVGRLRLEIREDADAARMALFGEFDIAAAADVGRALQELLSRGPSAVVIDLSGLDFMDSTGVRFLVEGRDRAQEAGVTLSLVTGSAAVQRVLTVSGLTKLFGDDDRA